VAAAAAAAAATRTCPSGVAFRIWPRLAFELQDYTECRAIDASLMHRRHHHHQQQQKKKKKKRK